MIGTYTLGQSLFFFLIVAIALLIDLMAHKSDKAISIRNAGLWTGFGYYLLFFLLPI